MRGEREKQETRAALGWAAPRTAAERGRAGVPVDEIAAEAGVSRTFDDDRTAVAARAALRAWFGARAFSAAGVA